MKVLKNLGVPVIDADLLGHKAYEPGTPSFAKIVGAFGKEVVGENGKINRAVLGGKVFGSQNVPQMKKLTDIVWPCIGELAKTEILEYEKKFQSQSDFKVPVIALEGAVLIEAGWYQFLDEVWVTYVPPEVAQSRIMQRNGLPPEEASKRIASQISNETRLQYASFSVNTNWEIEKTNQKVTEHYQTLLSRLNQQGIQALRNQIPRPKL
uniref:Dephospho-CoA kinase n=1 Tax=Arcella intermedia TaxID=1963864 RepID=A0A6B2LHG2_9EUKA